MKVRTRMDSGLNGLILGFFAMGWFAWGRAEASGRLSAAMIAGVVAPLAVAVVGAVRAFRPPRTEAAIQDRDARRRYGIVVGTESVLIVAGALTLGGTGNPRYIPVWICAVVGLHFFPLAPVLGDLALRWLGALVTAIAVAALLTGLYTGVAPSSVAGPGAGLALLAYATLALVGPTPSRLAA